MLKAGTASKATSVTIPNAPRLTRAARKSSTFCSAEQDTVRPFASINFSARTDCDRMPCLVELPCVAVLIAPAIDWWSILPKFGIAKPCPFSFAPRSCNRIPACMTTTFVSLLMSSISWKWSRLTSHEEVHVKSDGEWAQPTTVTRRRHLRASVRTFCSSSDV